MIATDLSKQQALDIHPKPIQKSLARDGNADTTEEAKETILDL